MGGRCYQETVLALKAGKKGFVYKYEGRSVISNNGDYNGPKARASQSPVLFEHSPAHSFAHYGCLFTAGNHGLPQNIHVTIAPISYLDCHYCSSQGRSWVRMLMTFDSQKPTQHVQYQSSVRKLPGQYQFDASISCGETVLPSAMRPIRSGNGLYCSVGFCYTLD